MAIDAVGDVSTFAVAQSRADRKESTAITPVMTGEDGTQQPDVNKKLTDVVITAYDNEGKELTNVKIEFKDGQFTIPEDSDHKIANVKVKATTVDKALAITALEPAAEQGKVKVSAETTELAAGKWYYVSGEVTVSSRPLRATISFLSSNLLVISMI